LYLNILRHLLGSCRDAYFTSVSQKVERESDRLVRMQLQYQLIDANDDAKEGALRAEMGQKQAGQKEEPKQKKRLC
jgi:hypothetical protein